MNENDRFRITIKNLREKYNLTQINIEILAGFTNGKYSRIENGTQDPNLEDVKLIARAYGLDSFKLIDPKLQFPKPDSLPKATRELANKNRSYTLKNKGDWDISNNIIAALKLHFKDKTFTNSEIIEKLPTELSDHMKGSSIEWNKGKLKGLVVRTGNKRKNINSNSEKGLEFEYRFPNKQND